MSRLQSALGFSAVIATFLCIFTTATASDKPLVIRNGEAKAERVKSFNGVLDRSKIIAAANDSVSPGAMPGSGPANQKELEALFKKWQLGSPPKVDFSSQIIVVNTWDGSRLDLLRGIDDEGNLWVTAAGGTKDLVSTPDGSRGTTYIIEVYTLTNIQSVNGRKWPFSRQEDKKAGANESAAASESDSTDESKASSTSKERPR